MVQDGLNTHCSSCTSKFQRNSSHSSQMFVEPFQLCLYQSAPHTWNCKSTKKLKLVPQILTIVPSYVKYVSYTQHCDMWNEHTHIHTHTNGNIHSIKKASLIQLWLALYHCPPKMNSIIRKTPRKVWIRKQYDQHFWNYRIQAQSGQWRLPRVEAYEI